MKADPEAAFATAIKGAGRGFDGRPVLAAAPAPMPTATIAPAAAHVLAPDAIILGADEYGAPLGIDLARLLDGRLLIQGVSGAGKSYLLRRLLEQTAGRIQQIVVDPEGEFGTLAEELGHLHVDASKLDASAMAMLGERVRAQRLSVVLDFSEIERTDQMIRLAAFIAALIDCPREMWNGALVAIDEAQLFAPKGAQAEEVPATVRKTSIGALVSMMGRGRKRGLVGVIATTRLAQMALSVVSPIGNYLIGNNTLDLDIKRAAEHIGWSARKASDRLPLLEAGQFVAVGHAFSQSPLVVKIGPVQSRHVGAAPVIIAPPVVDAGQAHAALDIDGLIEESARAREVAEETAPPSGMRAVRMFVRSPGFGLAGAVYEALKPLFPNGAVVADLVKHLKVDVDAVSAAIALLAEYAVVELTTVNDVPSVRIDKGFGSWKL